jgi:nucleotide-binding universal stress UspA family protein
MMPVVVGVDSSEESLNAVEWAAREARRHRAPLRIVSALAVPALGAAVTRAEEVAPGLLPVAPPALAVASSGTGALMLVVGARGAGGFAAMVLGSVSRYAAMHASCPVVVVREETSAVHREVAVGIRDPNDTTETLAFAFEEAALRGATLVAVHSADPGRISAEVNSSLTEALSGWRDKYPAVPVRQDAVRGHPARVLACYSARTDLVVIGRHDGMGAVPPSALSSMRYSTTPAGPSPSSPRKTDAGARPQSVPARPSP